MRCKKSETKWPWDHFERERVEREREIWREKEVERKRGGEKKRWRRERVHLEALRGTRTILYMFHGSFLGKITSLKTNSKHFESPST